jgi:hypothetical protein
MSDKKPAVKKDQKNGITRPKEGTTTRKVWDIADRLKERAPVLAECAKRKINAATATTQFGKWREYNGLKGKKTKKAAKPAKKVSAKKAKAPKATPAPAAVPEVPAAQ